MTRGVGGQSPANVQKFLEGIHYPASKDDLIATCARTARPAKSWTSSRTCRDEKFGGPQDVMKAYGEIK